MFLYNLSDAHIQLFSNIFIVKNYKLNAIHQWGEQNEAHDLSDLFRLGLTIPSMT